MDWINVKDNLPNKYDEVIVCYDSGRVKSAVYTGNGKWSTYNNVLFWMPYPSAPDLPKETNEETEAPKKRGRKKKVI